MVAIISLLFVMTVTPSVAANNVTGLMDGLNKFRVAVCHISEDIEDASNAMLVKRSKEILGGFKQTDFLLPPLSRWKDGMVKILQVTCE